MIPARGGSKGIPRKNLAPLAGRPLIAYTIDAARTSARLTRMIVSTDDEEIAMVARRLGADVPVVRPPELAADETPMVDVLVHLVGVLEQRERYHPDILVLLQPTSPFRRARHIDQAVDLLTASGADSVVSVIPVPHQFTPSSLLRTEGDRLVSVDDPTGNRIVGPMRRQDKPPLFARNGPAVVAARTEVVLERGTLYGPDTRGYVMSREESLDIDDAFDLRLAELLIASRV